MRLLGLENRNCIKIFQPLTILREKNKAGGITFRQYYRLQDFRQYYRNDRDLTEAEDIKKRCKEYTEGLYKNDLHDPDNHKLSDHSPRARHPGM